MKVPFSSWPSSLSRLLPVVPENSYLLTHDDLRRSAPLGEFTGICDNLLDLSVV